MQLQSQVPSATLTFPICVVKMQLMVVFRLMLMCNVVNFPMFRVVLRLVLLVRITSCPRNLQLFVVY